MEFFATGSSLWTCESKNRELQKKKGGEIFKDFSTRAIGFKTQLFTLWRKENEEIYVVMFDWRLCDDIDGCVCSRKGISWYRQSDTQGLLHCVY